MCVHNPAVTTRSAPALGIGWKRAQSELNLEKWVEEEGDRLLLRKLSQEAGFGPWPGNYRPWQSRTL